MIRILYFWSWTFYCNFVCVSRLALSIPHKFFVITMPFWPSNNVTLTLPFYFYFIVLITYFHFYFLYYLQWLCWILWNEKWTGIFSISLFIQKETSGRYYCWEQKINNRIMIRKMMNNNDDVFEDMRWLWLKLIGWKLLQLMDKNYFM